jgi:hypothetical protein
MSEEELGFSKQIIKTITSPRDALRTLKPEHFKRSIVLVILLSLLSSVAGYFYGSKIPLSSITPQVPQGIGGNAIGTLYALRSGIGSIIGWLIPILLIYVFSSVLSGRGSFKRLATLVGFSYIPMIFGQIIRIFDSYTISSKEIFELIVIGAANQSLQSRLIQNSFRLLNIFGVWSLILVVLSVKENSGSSNAKAIVSTVLAYLILLLLRSFGLRL